MPIAKKYFIKPVGLLASLSVLVSLLTAPALAQTPASFPFPLPLPSTTEPIYDVTPVDEVVPYANVPLDESLSFTLVPPPPDGNIPPLPSLLTSPSDRGPIALDIPTQARITNLAANVTTRMDMLVQRFEQISGRLEKRIAIEKAAGQDTSEAEVAWGDAVTTLINIKIMLSTIDTKVQDTVTSSDSYTAWGDLKISYFAISSQLLRVHRSLTTGVESLR